MCIKEILIGYRRPFIGLLFILSYACNTFGAGISEKMQTSEMQVFGLSNLMPMFESYHWLKATWESCDHATVFQVNEPCFFVYISHDESATITVVKQAHDNRKKFTIQARELRTLLNSSETVTFVLNVKKQTSTVLLKNSLSFLLQNGILYIGR